MSTRGNLQDIALADLIQQNCQDKKTAQLTLAHNGQQAALYFQNGQIVHATMGKEDGEEVVFQILDWSEGQFTLEPGIRAPVTSIRRSWSGLLLEGARRLDEGKLDDGVGATPVRTSSEARNMELDNVLKEMGDQIEGFVAAAVVGIDGINIAQTTRSKKADPEKISAQMTLLFKLVDTTVARLGAGVMEDDLVTTEGLYVLMRPLKDRNFYLGMAADRKTAQVGSMRLNSRIYADRIAKALPH